MIRFAKMATVLSSFSIYLMSFFSTISLGLSSAKYEPNWKSIDSRPLPDWFDEGKIGIFMHWGVFSVPSKGSEWFWESWKAHDNATVQFMKDNFKPNFTYADFAPMFTSEFFKPDQWTDLFNAAGAKPLPKWYDEGKIGIFITWGLYSVPSTGSEWFWESWKARDNATVQFMKDNFKPNFTYADFAPMFTSNFFKPVQWAELFNAAGAKYVVLTSKHHEGFTNWPSKYSFNWNSMDVGPNRDLVGELAAALRLNYPDIHFGLYHSLFEWFNPLYLEDEANNYTTNRFVKFKTMPELYELVNMYKPDVIWSDGDWMVDDFYWDALDFLTWLYNESPVKDTVAVNDRWGKNIRCKHGGFLNCDDRYNPGTLQKRKWENAMTLDRSSWGYRREATYLDYLSMEELLKTLITTISCGGNLLVNIGPTHDGRIIPIFEQRLREMGSWLFTNGDAIYKSKPWSHQNDTINSDVWYTAKPGIVYATVLRWPENNVLTLGAPITIPDTTTVTLLGYVGMFDWVGLSGGGINITIPDIPFYKMPCKWAWVFMLEGLSNRCVMEEYGSCIVK